MKAIIIEAIGAILLAGCGTSGGSATSTTCRASINNFVTEASTTGPFTYDCANQSYGFASDPSVKIEGVVGNVKVEQSDLNLTIESSAVTGVEHRSGYDNAALHGAFDCTDVYTSELPTTVGTSSEIKTVIEDWVYHWTRDDTQSDCPDWVRALDPDNYDTVTKSYSLSTSGGSGSVSIKTYWE